MASGATISPRALGAGLRTAAPHAETPGATAPASGTGPVRAAARSAAPIPGARAVSVSSRMALRPTAVVLPVRATAVTIAEGPTPRVRLAATPVAIPAAKAAAIVLARVATARTAVPVIAAPRAARTARVRMATVLTTAGEKDVRREAAPTLRVPRGRIARPIAATTSAPAPAVTSGEPRARGTSTAAAARTDPGSSETAGTIVRAGTAPVAMIGRPMEIALDVMIDRRTATAPVPIVRRARIVRVVMIRRPMGTVRVVMTGPRTVNALARTAIDRVLIDRRVLIGPAVTTAAMGETAPVVRIARRAMIAVPAIPGLLVTAAVAVRPMRSGPTARSVMTVRQGVRARQHALIVPSSLDSPRRSPGESSTRRSARSFAA